MSVRTPGRGTDSLAILAGEVAADGIAPDRIVRTVRESVSGGLLPDDDRVRRCLTAWAEHDVRVVLPRGPGWPTRLQTLPKPPALLALRGALPDPEAPAVAIVGQRRATPYGREVTAWLAEAAARAGVTVVSGGALGIDAAAHRAAVAIERATVVVLGCGHDVRYPRPHATTGGLFDQVVDAGGAVVSELLPGTEPRAARFLARNRLIAALADAVVVVEGRERSGALNTASHAGDLGVPVLAVPGDVRAPGSAAPNALLAEGAAPCRDPDDLLAAVGGAFCLRIPDAVEASVVTVLPDTVRDVLARAFPRPVPMEDLADLAGVDVGSLLALVTRARIAGDVATDADGIRLRRAPAG